MCVFTAAATGMLGMGTAGAAMAANVSLGVGAASSMMQYQGARDQARSQDEWNRQRQLTGTERAMEAYAQAVRQGMTGLSQYATAASMEIEDISRQSRRAQSTAILTAGEAGVGGKSVDALLQDFERQELNYQTNVRVEQEWKELDVDEQLEAVRIGTQGRIEQLQFMQAQRPSFIGAGLRIARYGVNAMSMFNQTWGPAVGSAPVIV